MNEKIENEIIEVLNAVYQRADWKKITGHGRISKYDVFAHRVKSAAYQENVKKFLEKLCHGLGLQSVNVNPQVIADLDKHRDQVLKALREETIYYILCASKSKKKEGGEKEK